MVTSVTTRNQGKERWYGSMIMSNMKDNSFTISLMAEEPSIKTTKK